MATTTLVLILFVFSNIISITVAYTLGRGFRTKEDPRFNKLSKAMRKRIYEEFYRH